MAPRTTRTTQRDALSQIPAPVSSKRPQPPQWPCFSALPPSSDLELAPLLPEQILTIPDLWTFNLCKRYVRFLSTLPLATTPDQPKKGEAVRVNDRFQVDDAEFAERLWSQTALHDLIVNAKINDKTLTEKEKHDLWGGEVLGLSSNIRIYRYSKGQFFDQHYDESNIISFPSPSSPSPTPARTSWTLLLYLTSHATGCHGGETVFYPEAASKRDATPPPVITEPVVGMALLHRHGTECLLHEGREVTQGEKWIIRSDLCVRL